MKTAAARRFPAPPFPPQHVVLFSGGLGSWAAASRVIADHGLAGVVLLFCDTLSEDKDLYRFIHEAAHNIGAPLITLCDGRTPWQVMQQQGFIGNNLHYPCSRALKRQLAHRWLRAHCDPMDTTIYVGIDWTEEHRLAGIRAAARQWRYTAPLCNPPYLSKQQIQDLAERAGLCIPRLYSLGFPHNNCGGACVRGGQTQWVHLLKTFPDRFRQIEEWEQKMRARVGDYSILRTKRGGAYRPLTLAQLRQRVELGLQTDKWEWGGCGCMTQ